MKSMLCRILIPSVLLLAGRLASAEDIDLFVRSDPASSAPNVLFVIDNAASFSASSNFNCPIEEIANGPNELRGTVGGIEQCALYRVIDDLPADSVNIGIMVYNDSKVVDFQGRPCAGTVASKPGGCLVYEMSLLTDTSKVDLLRWIARWKNSTTPGGDKFGMIKAAQSATGGTMQEAWAYLFGRMGVSGTLYERPPPNACNTYIIFIGNSADRNGTPGDPQKLDKGPLYALEGLNRNAKSLMNASPAATTEQKSLITRQFVTTCGTITIGPSNHESYGYYADEWARYLNAQNVTTYTIGVIEPGRCQPEYAATLTSMADVGGGKYFPTTNFDELVAAMKAALSEMLAVNSVFASVSLPVSVNTEGTYLNQVYIGMFRPEANTRPRWVGNLKQYRLGRVPANDPSAPLKLVDAREPYREAISDARTGFIAPCALSYWNATSPNSYWTPANSNGYWPYPYPRQCQEDGATAASDTPDGPLVEKGAQGYRLRRTAVADRNLKACDSSDCGGLGEFNTGNAAIRAEDLHAGSDAERTQLINWARGLNNSTDETFVGSSAMRPSVHGDVVHSRPVAIDFRGGDTDPPAVVVFYGGNDGVLRAVNGNPTDQLDGVVAGGEIWGFVPPEFYGHIKRLRSNAPNIVLRGLEDGRLPKPYGFDGPITSYVDGSTRWIFATMRRGGRMIYAFDVSNLTNDPDSPSLLWRFGCQNDGTCTAGALEMGQSWSAPKPIKASGYTESGQPAPMVIFGGGYDACEDADPHSCDSSAKGNRVYVLNARTGERLAALPTDRPVVADVFVVPGTEAGIAKLAYAVDMGGNVYRISGLEPHEFGSTHPRSWTITKIADLGCLTVSPCTANRKFMFTPDVVLDSRPDGYVLLLGSGDREKPLHTYLSWDAEAREYQGTGYPSAYATSNYFFMLRDFPRDPDWLASEESSGRCGDQVLCLNSLTAITGSDTPTADELEDKKGWYLGLRTGEQVVTSAITVFGGTTFSTHAPTDPRDRAACTSDLGTARVYNIKYANAMPAKPNATDRSAEIYGGGLPPSPVAGLVRIGDQTVPFIIGADPESPLQGGEPAQPSLTTLPKSISYWYVEK